MTLADEAHAVVLLADHVAVDAAGKINALGAWFSVAGLQPNGMTAAMCVAAVVDVPSAYAGEEFALSLDLLDLESGEVVALGGPDGQPEAVRIQQVARVERPQVPGVTLPAATPCRTQATLAFPTGLPLPPGRAYAWRLSVDGHHRPDWRAGFVVPGRPPAPPPPPVYGGPAGPSDVGLPPGF